MGVYVFLTTCLRDEVSCNCLLDCIAFTGKYYKNIIVIDDTPENGVNIYQLNLPRNVRIIKNEFHKSGEITRIWYFWKYCQKGDIGILIHDSTFINSHIPIPNKDFTPLFSFIHKWDDVKHEREFLLSYPNLLRRYDDKTSWKGAFGVQYVAKWEFIDKMMNLYGDLFMELLEKVKTRDLRSCMERVIQVIFLETSSNTQDDIYGTIHDYTTRHWGVPWGVEYSTLEQNMSKAKKFPIIKIWVGR